VRPVRRAAGSLGDYAFMTLEDFKSHVRDYRRFELLRGVLFFGLLFGLAFPTLFVGRRIDRVGFDALAITIISVSYIAVAILMFYVLAPMRRKQLSKLRGECPACGRLLLGKSSHAVMDTGRCPHCSSQILQS
jgi:DNA-directed RNA polymerase subunit RPC12/RpoP